MELLFPFFFWILFDLLTTTTGLFSKAVLSEIENPVLAFPLYAEKILSSGSKGFFYAALFATIISTSNSFLFLSASTFGRDFIYKFYKKKHDNKLASYTRIGLIVSVIISIVLAYFVQSVIVLWYTIGSVCIPGIILLVFGAYYDRMKVSENIALIEITGAVIVSIIWILIRESLQNEFVNSIEPMLIGLFFSIIVHFVGIIIRFKQKNFSS